MSWKVYFFHFSLNARFFHSWYTAVELCGFPSVHYAVSYPRLYCAKVLILLFLKFYTLLSLVEEEEKER